MFHSEDAKKYGIDKNTTSVCRSTRAKLNESYHLLNNLYGTTAQVADENLGLNSILGYVESFTANYHYRMCLIDKASVQTVFSENDPCVMHQINELSKQHYIYLVENPRVYSCFGITHNSILSSLSYFNVSDNFVFDIMHDILEGVAQYEIKLLFEYLNQNFISNENMPQHIQVWLHG